MAVVVKAVTRRSNTTTNWTLEAANEILPAAAAAAAAAGETCLFPALPLWRWLRQPPLPRLPPRRPVCCAVQVDGTPATSSVSLLGTKRGTLVTGTVILNSCT